MHIRKFALAMMATIGGVGTANAAVVTLNDITGNGANDFTYSYQATLGPDEGLRSGDRIIIFDFAGYVAGSIFTGSANLVGSVENVSTGTLLTPGMTDDPSLANLVFTYTGPNFRTGSGPLAPFSFSSIGARSTFGEAVADAFFSVTTKNNPASERGRRIYQLGQTLVPNMNVAVPEPATWAMMIGGFALAGAAARRQTRAQRVSA